jgi:hypothetical protein
MSTYRTSQLIASTSSSFQLRNDSRTIVVDFKKGYNIDSLLKQLHSGDSKKSLSLHLQHIKGSEVLPPIDVYLNLEHGNEPNDSNYVGSMGLYGLPESSEHDGSGQDKIFNVGPVFSRVRDQRNWSDKQFKLTLFPVSPLPGPVTIGRVALYYFES